MYETVKSLREEGVNISNITLWGVVDKNSWLQTFNAVGGAADGKNKQCPLLFDDDYQVKPAYWAFVDGSRLEAAEEKPEESEEMPADPAETTSAAEDPAEESSAESPASDTQSQVQENASVQSREPDTSASGGSRVGLYAALAAVCVVLAAGAVGFVLVRRKKDKK